MSQKTGAPALTGKLPQNLTPFLPFLGEGHFSPGPRGGFLQTFGQAAVQWIREEYRYHSKTAAQASLAL